MAHGGGTNLLSLPDAVLETICSLVPDRPVLGQSFVAPQRHVALTCRRLRAAANSPAALRALAATIGKARPPSDDDLDKFLPALRSLCHFVQHVAAPHVRQLQLKLRPTSDLEPADWAEAGMLLGSLLQACSSLEALELVAKGAFELTLSSWASGLTSLRRLVVCSPGVLVVTADLRRLSELRYLILYGAEEVDLEPTCRLPPSLARFDLQRANALPSQLSALTDLHSLYLTQPFCGPDEFGVLERLSSLRHLTLTTCQMPSCLGRLTALRELRLLKGTLHFSTDAAVCGDALPRLTNLRHLIMHDLPAAVCEALPGCSLHIFGVCPPKPGVGLPAALPAALPAGPWLAALQELTLPAAVLHASIPQLRAAARLQHVGVLQAAGNGLANIVSWAVGHAPLRLLAIASDQAMLPTAWACVLEAQRRRPELCIKPCADALEEVAAHRRQLEQLP